MSTPQRIGIKREYQSSSPPQSSKHIKLETESSPAKPQFTSPERVPFNLLELPPVSSPLESLLQAKNKTEADGIETEEEDEVEIKEEDGVETEEEDRVEIEEEDGIETEEEDRVEIEEEDGIETEEEDEVKTEDESENAGGKINDRIDDRTEMRKLQDRMDILMNAILGLQRVIRRLTEAVDESSGLIYHTHHLRRQ